MTMTKVKAAVIGGSGYTGLELLRLLATHPEVEVSAVTSRQYEGCAVGDVFPSLKTFYDGLDFTSIDDALGAGADVVFLALPHGTAMGEARRFSDKAKLIVDLSADFRLKDKSVYEEWYQEHTEAGLLKGAVYGLPELFRQDIKGIKGIKGINGTALIANPGCYPTGAALALAPLLKGEGKVDPSSIIIDSKSGISGAGRRASVETSFVETAQGFKAYKVASHRHTPEIEQTLSIISGLAGVAGEGIKVSFTPHLLPVSRGILTTAYATLTGEYATADTFDTANILALYEAFYKDEPFVRVLSKGLDVSGPDIKCVRGSNFCDIGVTVDKRTGRVVVVSAIDNLVKGASGQAIQNMNIALGIDETLGLKTPPLEI